VRDEPVLYRRITAWVEEGLKEARSVSAIQQSIRQPVLGGAG
jgi:hypothetical protein